MGDFLKLGRLRPSFSWNKIFKKKLAMHNMFKESCIMIHRAYLHQLIVDMSS